MSNKQNKHANFENQPSNQNDEVMIRVENLGKRFCRDLKRSLFYGIQDIACELLGRDRSKSSLREKEFYANQGISFELRRGECLGLIGHNGAGKTTLLKMLNGLIKPDVGVVEMRGKVGALIALGAGFNPILTGRENVYIAGSVLGLSKAEIEAKYDEIVDFADIEAFMESPVQSYSSGMQVRLGFAVAAAMEPDILLIDEVLAVGDVGFRMKCYNRINELKEKAAVIFVSHNVGHIGRLCDKSVLLNKGQIEFYGETSKAVNLYSSQSSVEENRQVNLAEGCALERVLVNGRVFETGMSVAGDKAFTVEFAVSFGRHLKCVECSVVFLSESSEVIAMIDNRFQGEDIVIDEDYACFRVKANRIGLGTGKKTLGIIVRDGQSQEMLVWAHPFGTLNIVNELHVGTPILISGEFSKISKKEFERD